MLCCCRSQVHRLQAVIGEKDVRFQEQIQKHEEELLTVSAQAPVDTELQQVTPASASGSHGASDYLVLVGSKGTL